MLISDQNLRTSIYSLMRGLVYAETTPEFEKIKDSLEGMGEDDEKMRGIYSYVASEWLQCPFIWNLRFELIILFHFFFIE